MSSIEILIIYLLLTYAIGIIMLFTIGVSHFDSFLSRLTPIGWIIFVPLTIGFGIFAGIVWLIYSLGQVLKGTITWNWFIRPKNEIEKKLEREKKAQEKLINLLKNRVN